MTKEELLNEFMEYAKRDLEGAIQLSTGIFVGLNIAFVDIHGEEGDGQKQIDVSVIHRTSSNARVIIELEKSTAQKIADGHKNLNDVMREQIKRASDWIEEL